MAEIMSAKCTVCGLIFKGENCIEEAEEHEKIPIEEPIYEVGDTLIYPESNGEYSTIHTIHTIGVSTDEHKVMYNGIYNCVNVFKLPVFEQNGVRIISKDNLLSHPAYADLREKMLDLYVNGLLLGIHRNMERYDIDKILGWKRDD